MISNLVVLCFFSPSADSSGDELSKDPGRSLICLSASLLSWVKFIQSISFHYIM